MAMKVFTRLCRAKPRYGLLASSQKCFSTDKQYGDFTNLKDDYAQSTFDPDYYQADRVSNEEHGLILGLAEFEQSVTLFHEKRYDEAEFYLKDALKILKGAQQEKSLGYLYVLKKLAHCCFMNRKYSEAEKYFSVNAQIVPKVTKNPANIFNA